MSDRKKHQDESEEVHETTGEALASDPQAEMSESSARLEAGTEALTQRLEEAEARSAQNLDGWQRTQAEFQNYRKRIERDNALIYAGMKGDIIRKFLPVLDDLERALHNRPTDSGPWVSGIELIHKNLQSILESEGVERIQAEGAAFDPNFHEAVSHETADGVESGHVIAVTRSGYILGEKVLRPALVRVAR